MSLIGNERPLPPWPQDWELHVINLFMDFFDEHRSLVVWNSGMMMLSARDRWPLIVTLKVMMVRYTCSLRLGDDGILHALIGRIDEILGLTNPPVRWLGPKSKVILCIPIPVSRCSSKSIVFLAEKIEAIIEADYHRNDHGDDHWGGDDPEDSSPPPDGGCSVQREPAEMLTV